VPTPESSFDVAKVAIIQKKKLAKFGYIPDMKVLKKSITSSIFLATLLDLFLKF
jgi:hypothetical protein